MSENRFKRVSSDPRFKKIPRKHRKVKIDARFQQMFTDKRFTTKYFVDKRGAVVGKTSKEDLHQFYDLSDGEEETKPDQESNTNTTDLKSSSEVQVLKDSAVKKSGKKTKTLQKSKAKAKSVKQKSSKEDTVDDSDSESDVDDNNENTGHNQNQNKMKDNNDSASAESDNEIIDYARGEGNIESSSEDDDSDDDGNDDDVRDMSRNDSDEETDEEDTTHMNEDEVEHDWGEHDKGVKTRSEATRRIAICNLDWDRLTAKDIFVLFNAVGSKGVVQSVKIYPSEFGLERMKMEDSYGPEEFRNTANTEDDDKDGNNQEGSEFSREKLRQYQLNKLKYYYAVVECDSPETANFLYEECDGVEFEMTGNLLDLRFIPDDMVFEHEPTSIATEMPDLASYQPPEFETAALHQSNVKLTWDETDSSRIKTTMRKFNKDDLQEMDFQAYLASSDDEEQVDRSDEGGSEDEEDRIAKYKRLIQDIDKKEHDDDHENDMEIMWEPGLKESAEDLVTRKVTEKNDKKLTPWEVYLSNKKEKKKEKRNKKNKPLNEEEDADDIPDDVDMSDPFFSQDFGPDFPSKDQDSQQKTKKGKVKRDEPETEEQKKSKEELELLLMDDGDDRQHFSLKGILENEKKSSKKKKRRTRGKDDEKTATDAFAVNVDDPRFTAMYTSHHYALDPSDPQFKRTKAVDAILSEKHRRRDDEAQKTSEHKTTSETKVDRKKTKDPSLSLLVKSVKSKTEQFQHRKKKRKTTQS